MGKLHELIAVEKDRKATAAKIIEETETTFAKKQSLFAGFTRVYETKTDDNERFDSEESQVVTTVPDKLDYFEEHIENLLDVILQKETTNVEARGDVTITSRDGTAIELAKDVPVSALVQMENLLESIRNKVYDNIPTLDPKNKWEIDAQAGKNRFRTKEQRKRKTRKHQDFLVVVPATKEHPAQVKEVVKDIYTGDWVETHFSGMISPAEKSELLGRVSTLIESVKKARARANGIDVKDVHIGKRLFQYIRSGK